MSGSSDKSKERGLFAEVSEVMVSSGYLYRYTLILFLLLIFVVFSMTTSKSVLSE